MQNSRAQSIRGLFLPLPTVFDGAGQVDYPLMKQLTQFYLDVGVPAFFLLGSFGQGPALSPEERKKVAEFVVREIRGKVPVVVHVGGVDPYTTIELGRHADSLGVDGIGVVGPYYYSDRNEYELVETFKLIGQSVPLPLLIYNNPKYSGYQLTPALMAKIKRETPNFFAAKLAMGTVEEAVEYLKLLGHDFATFIISSYLVSGFQNGVRGSISPPLAVVPELGVSLVKEFDAGNMSKALEIQEKIKSFEATIMKLMKVYGRTALGVGLRMRGFDVKQYPRWPAPKLSSEDEKVLRASIEQVAPLRAVSV
jgi:dihydrodipicolinate synthase/N-acetylneuraminate lyase